MRTLSLFDDGDGLFAGHTVSCIHADPDRQGASEIQRRALLAMVNEAALLLAEGVAARPSDIDVVLVQGYGFPRWEGGPVFWARQQDRAALDNDLQTLAGEAGHDFVLAELSVLLG